MDLWDRWQHRAIQRQNSLPRETAPSNGLGRFTA
jgi:hypothetical protein